MSATDTTYALDDIRRAARRTGCRIEPITTYDPRLGVELEFVALVEVVEAGPHKGATVDVIYTPIYSTGQELEYAEVHPRALTGLAEVIESRVINDLGLEDC
jgi:hypothetical protein